MYNKMAQISRHMQDHVKGDAMMGHSAKLPTPASLSTMATIVHSSVIPIVCSYCLLMVKGIYPSAIFRQKGLSQACYHGYKYKACNSVNSQPAILSHAPASPQKAFSVLQFLEFFLLDASVDSLPLNGTRQDFVTMGEIVCMGVLPHLFLPSFP